MKRTRTEKGITLVALIITIIVLLILAVVAINAVQEDGIIKYAKNARDDYQRAQANESALLANYTNYLKDNVTTTKIITFTIGDDTYQAREGDTWLDWINSEYNTIGCYIDGGVVYSSDGENTLRNDLVTETVEKNDTIIENHEYTWVTWNTGDWG